MAHFPCTGMICILLIVLAAPVAADYPMFGADEARTGAITTSGPLTNATLWVEETAEYADGSPAVHDGKVFVPTWPDMVFDDNGLTGLVCYDAATGEELWTNELGGAAVGSVSGTAVMDGKIYLGGTDGKLYCIDEETGATLWSSEKIDETGYFGLSSSPLVYDGKVYTLSASDGVLHEFDLDGTETWSFTTGGAAGYFVSPAAADRKVYCSNMTALFCIDPSTQGEIWNTSVSDVLLSTPTAGENAIFCAGAINTYAFDRETGDERWNVSLAGTSSSPAVDASHLYVGAKDGLHCLDTITGAERWTFPSAQITVSPVVADGTVYFATNEETGTVYAVNTTTGDEVWSYTLEAPGDNTFASFYASSPAVSEGVLYLGAENNHLYAFGEGSPHPEIIFDGTVSLTDATFTFIPSNNASASYEVNHTTDLGALGDAADLGEFTFKASDSWYDSYSSFSLESIDGIANEDWTNPDARSWSIFINNQSAPMGLGRNSLDDGDLLEFFYCPVNETTYAPLTDEADAVVRIRVSMTEATLSALTLTDGNRGGSVRADVTASAVNEGRYVIVVSGTDENGESLAGTGTVYLNTGESIGVPVLVTVPLQAKTGTYTLHAGIYQIEEYPQRCLFMSEGVECAIT
ncbi:outer membrane protein assembly factor BamB [Methanofollis sp. W23]|uniref:outer membrane protein assembly factor BamB family protein n=1 Tax=Methanofollis sp. W23 TaxID=2817849 RepID=UPI001AE7FB97|nr:PQQ-binding-like beta-propeller repeat protein [Methanofollis sp. W23]MBP2146511.1 outer membrane protein assembly factor BamB [Methanofollis sp. W23]